MTQWWTNDISGPQRSALVRLLATARGCAYAGNLPGVRLATLRALHRYGLVRTDGGEVIQSNTFVYITESGRHSVPTSEAASTSGAEGALASNVERK